MNVTLTWPECELAAYAGMKRRLLAQHDGAKHRSMAKFSDEWGKDIESTAAELAVARAFNMYWTAWARRASDVEADVGENVQVRRSDKRSSDLIVRPYDREDHIYVLVRGSIPQFELVGWLWGSEAKSNEFWGDPYGTNRPPAFWIPADRLRSVDYFTNKPVQAAEEMAA